jgi:hypothetical protein
MIVTPSERLPLVTLRNVDAMSHPSRGAIHTTLHSRARINSDFMFSTYTWRLTPSLSWLDKVWP